MAAQLLQRDAAQSPQLSPFRLQGQQPLIAGQRLFCPAEFVQHVGLQAQQLDVVRIALQGCGKSLQGQLASRQGSLPPAQF